MRACTAEVGCVTSGKEWIAWYEYTLGLATLSLYTVYYFSYYRVGAIMPCYHLPFDFFSSSVALNQALNLTE